MGISGLEIRADGDELSRVRFLYLPRITQRVIVLAREAVKPLSIYGIEFMESIV